MVPTEVVKVVLPNVKRNVPGGGSWFWRICSRGTLASVGLASRGFLKLQRNVKVEGMDKFLNILETQRDRGIITGISSGETRFDDSFEPFISVKSMSNLF